MSMISVDNLYYINQRMMDIFDSKDDFGGRALILVGDVLQLPPVMGRPIFSEPRMLKNRILKNMTNKHDEAIGDLWQNLQVVVLKRNFRQGEGDPWTELLNRARVGESTDEDIKLLRSKKHTLLSKEQYDLATHLFYTNPEVLEHNTHMLNSMPSELIEIEAKVDVPKGSGYKPQINAWGLIDKTNYTMHLELKIGARVMLIYNVCIPDNLVNGRFGTLIDITVTKTGEPEALIISFDNPETGVEQRQEFKLIAEKYKDQNGCPIFKEPTEYNIDCKSKKARKEGKVHGAKCKLTQFPIRLAWATTGHKVQGVTFKRGIDVVMHCHKKMPNSLLYVMLSRPESMENVFLKDFDPKYLEPNELALEEDKKLDDRSINHHYEEMHFDFFILNIRSLSKHLIDLNHDMYAQKSDHICVVETWIDPDNVDITEFQMPGRQFDHASIRKGQGCGIYSIDSKHDSEKVKVAKEKYSMISFINGNVQFVLVYLSSNCQMQLVVQELQKTLKPDMVNIIAGDFNFDKEEKNIMTRFLDSKDFVQLVHDPTQDDGRTIDHCYVPNNIKSEIHLTTYSPYYSDHDALCIKFDFEK